MGDKILKRKYELHSSWRVVAIVMIELTSTIGWVKVGSASRSILVFAGVKYHAMNKSTEA